MTCRVQKNERPEVVKGKRKEELGNRDGGFAGLRMRRYDAQLQEGQM
jgi:hypothetical protein